MLFKRFYDDQLAQASYMLACEAEGVAMIVDPNRDAEFYMREAARERLRIVYVAETHIHADFVSGSRELARAASAQLLLSDEGGDDGRYTFAAESGATMLRDGSEISLGNVRVQALHTPGHTPEHLAFLVTDRPASNEPLGMLSGDFIFVGDVGRPDLLEKAANKPGTMEGAARTLFRSLQRIRSLPDYLQIWPGHGAGSACGKALGSMPQSTLGFERISNWALQVSDEDTFVREVLHDQPSPPRYFGVMKLLNKNGPAILGGLRPPSQISTSDLVRLSENGGMIIDARAASSFSKGHIAGAINVPLNKSFTKYAGSVVPYDRDLCLVVDKTQTDAASTATRHLAMIGLDRVKGFVSDESIREWQSSGRAIETATSISSAEAATRIANDEVNVLDVRDQHEVDAAHLSGAQIIPLGVLANRIAEIPREKPLLIYCQTGNRSGIAASLLSADGMKNVINLAGGISAWQKAGLEVETALSETAAH